MTMQEATQGKDFHILQTKDGYPTLKQNHNYWHQVQGQLHIKNRQLCFFVVWNTKEHS